MAEFGTPETWNMKVGDFIETQLPKEKPQALLDLQEQNRKQRLLDSLQKIGPGLMDESLDFIRRDQLAFGSRDKPKRGLVDEPGSYSITAKEQKNIDAWNKRLKSAIKAGVAEPFEKLSFAKQYRIRQGENAGLPVKKFGKFIYPIETQFGVMYTDKLSDTNLTKKSAANINAWEKATGKSYLDEDSIARQSIRRSGADYTPKSEISAKKILKDKALDKEKKKKVKAKKIRNDKILKIINNNPGLNANQIARRANVEPVVVKTLANNLGIDLQTRYDQLLPELKTLDKLVKKNAKFLSGDSSILDKRKLLFAEMQKQFGPNYTVTSFFNRMQTLGNKYIGGLEQAEAYKTIKTPKNYKGSNLHKNIVALAKKAGLGVVGEARLLGLPENQIQLLEDVLGGAKKLTKMSVAGDHTDINALMKNFPEYKKNFTRINIISDRLNTEKSYADSQLIKLVRQLNNKEITPQEFTTQVDEVRTNFTNKTKVPIGNPTTDARGNISLDFQTPRLIDLKNPKNKAISQAVTNLIEQEGVKFSEFDTQYSQANTVKDRFNLLKNATTETLQKSKIIKGFAEMSGNVGEAAKNILKTKTGKVGAAGLLYTLATAAGPRPTETDLVDEVALTGEEEGSLAGDIGAGVGLTTGAAIGSKATQADPLKGARRFGKQGAKNLIKFLASPTVAAGFAGSELAEGNIKTAGASLLAPELAGTLASKGGQGILSRAGSILMNPFGRAARAFTPVGLATIGAGALKDVYDEYQRRQALTDEERLAEDLERDRAADEMMVGAAEGGRIGFADGPDDPSKRKFMKLMGILSLLPFGIGKGVKMATKATPVVTEGVKLGFDKFMMLVNKIKELGTPTSKVTQKEREVGYTYTGKDGSEYELVEDLTTGDIRVTKDKPGFTMSGDEAFDTIEDRSTFVLKKGQADETTKGKTPPDEYDEVKEVASPDGTFDDVDEISDEAVKEVLDEID